MNGRVISAISDIQRDEAARACQRDHAAVRFALRQIVDHLGGDALDRDAHAFGFLSQPRHIALDHAADDQQLLDRSAVRFERRLNRD